MNDKNSFRMVLGSVVVLVIIAQCYGDCRASDFYQWTNDYGVVSMTDALQRIPTKYRDKATERNFKDIDVQFIGMAVSSSQRHNSSQERVNHTRSILATLDKASPSSSKTCPGPISITKERRDYQERDQKLNSMFFVSRNSCGEIVQVSRQRSLPITNILR